MPVYQTPEPISAVLKLVVGDTRIVASDRTDTTVDIQPRNAANNLDVRAVEETTVEFRNGTLTVKAPKPNRLWGRTGAIEVTIELPSGSAVSCQSATGDVTTEGRLGACRFKTASGDFHLGHLGGLDLDTPNGDVAVALVDGNASVSAGGTMRIDAITGTAHIKNISGDTWVGECSGEASFNTASGDIVVARAEQNVTARTAAGDIRLLDVVRGTMSMQAASGELEVGIRQGSAAWLDVNTLVGSVHSELAVADHSEGAPETVKVKARTFNGNILVHRAG
ncbi:DUF4097 family beta strand repeat-containing protein [Labedaea rhizosphaerae]|uniref:Putative adhesin n=1 Tax=Labedaea rhizosphaerae TaxID=598644 RepID=A0A4R6S4D4_LABRH|nr:DUF4097 family beta strand repeat-containing protein [Labedaea rhizosphaerae]TDP94104.1 putative adhesin [Labedaea rhizosphaerae]